MGLGYLVSGYAYYVRGLAGSCGCWLYRPMLKVFVLFKLSLQFFSPEHSHPSRWPFLSSNLRMKGRFTTVDLQAVIAEITPK